MSVYRQPDPATLQRRIDELESENYALSKAVYELNRRSHLSATKTWLAKRWPDALVYSAGALAVCLGYVHPTVGFIVGWTVGGMFVWGKQ